MGGLRPGNSVGELEKRANFQYYQLVRESHANYNFQYRIQNIQSGTWNCCCCFLPPPTCSLTWLWQYEWSQLSISQKWGVIRIRVENCPVTSGDINMKERAVQLFCPDVWQMLSLSGDEFVMLRHSKSNNYISRAWRVLCNPFSLIRLGWLHKSCSQMSC